MIPPIRFQTLPEQDLIAYLREVEPSFTDDTARDLIRRQRAEWEEHWSGVLPKPSVMNESSLMHLQHVSTARSPVPAHAANEAARIGLELWGEVKRLRKLLGSE
jgi:hypothetical protein